MRIGLLVFLLLTTCAFAQTGSPLEGKWEFIMDTEGGERRVEPVFHVEGTTVTGKWDKTDVKGVFENGKLLLKFPMNSEEGGFSADLKITGELKDGELKGTWEFGQYSGTYRGKKKG